MNFGEYYDVNLCATTPNHRLHGWAANAMQNTAMTTPTLDASHVTRVSIYRSTRL